MHARKKSEAPWKSDERKAHVGARPLDPPGVATELTQNRSDFNTTWTGVMDMAST